MLLEEEKIEELFRRKQASRARGLTLLELLLGATLVSLVGLSFASIYGSSVSYLSRETLSISAQSEASYAMEHIRRHLMLATGVTTPADPTGGASFPLASSPTFTYSWSPVLDDPATPGVNEGLAIPSTYQLNGGGQLVYIENGGTPEIIARNVTGLSFIREAPNLVTVSLTVRRAVGGTIRNETLVTSIVHRGIPPP